MIQKLIELIERVLDNDILEYEICSLMPADCSGFKCDGCPFRRKENLIKLLKELKALQTVKENLKLLKKICNITDD
jgi:predicted metal-binding protein